MCVKRFGNFGSFKKSTESFKEFAVEKLLKMI